MRNKKLPLLSICIPTWNRCHFLEKSLISIEEQLNGLYKDAIEIYISDNCSDDSTPQLVKNFISRGLPINYYRQSVNIGASRNFIHCMNNCTGEYILLLGDDDILKSRALEKLLLVLSERKYGLVYIYDNNANGKSREFDNKEEFLKYISFWITFMSGNIFRREVVPLINSNQYTGTHLLQMPYYITSALSYEKNLVYGENVIEGSLDKSNNGGFNFYEVFVQNYLNIYQEFVDKRQITNKTFQWLKKDIFQSYIIPYSFKFFVLKQNVKKEDGVEGRRSGYKVEYAKELLYKYYGDEWYYHFKFLGYIRCFLGYAYHRIIKLK